MVVGNVDGSTGLSAVAIGGDVTNFLTFVAMGFANAGQVIISQYIGADQKEKVGKFIGTLVSFLLCFAVVFGSVCLLLRIPILKWMNTPAESWDDALSYSTTCIAGLIFIYGYNSISAILRGVGDSKHPFLFISIAAIINILLDIFFVAGLKMRAFGAALATVMSQAISFIWAVVFLYRHRERLGFKFKVGYLKINPALLMILVRLGVPMAIKSASIQFSRLFVNSWINSYGVIVSAVAGISNKLNKISNLFSNSMNAAGSSMVGQNIGAEKYRRVSRIVFVVFIINIIISSVMALALIIFPAQIFGIFTSDKSILGVAKEFLPIGVLIFFASAFRSPMNALMNGSGNYKINFVVALLDGFIIRIGGALLLGIALNLGYMGFWYGDALASFTPFVIGLVYYISGGWKTTRYVIEETN